MDALALVPRTPQALPCAITERWVIQGGETDMPDKKSSAQEGARLARLKTALVAERRLLGLDIHSVLARAETLLGDTLCRTLPANDSIVMLSKEHPLN